MYFVIFRVNTEIIIKEATNKMLSRTNNNNNRLSEKALIQTRYGMNGKQIARW